MQEAGYAMAVPDHPRLRQEALVQVRVLHEQRIVLSRAQETLRCLGLLELGKPDVPQIRARSRFRHSAWRHGPGRRARHAGRARRTA